MIEEMERSRNEAGTVQRMHKKTQRCRRPVAWMEKYLLLLTPSPLCLSKADKLTLTLASLYVFICSLSCSPFCNYVVTCQQYQFCHSVAWLLCAITKLMSLASDSSEGKVSIIVADGRYMCGYNVTAT